jgi:hypothetical protein
VGAVVNRGLGKGVNIAGGVLGAAAKALESLFAPPTPPTPAQAEEMNRRSEHAATQSAAAHQQQEVSEADYQLTKQRWAEQAEKREQEGKDFKRYRGDDRDRDRL